MKYGRLKFNLPSPFNSRSIIPLFCPFKSSIFFETLPPEYSKLCSTSNSLLFLSTFSSILFSAFACKVTSRSPPTVAFNAFISNILSNSAHPLSAILDTISLGSILLNIVLLINNFPNEGSLILCPSSFICMFCKGSLPSSLAYVLFP